MLSALIGASAAPGLAGQAAPSPLLRGRATGVTVDRFEAGGFGITTVSLRVTELRPHGVGTDFALSAWPEALAHGGVVLGVDVGPAYNVAGPNSTVLVKTGLSTAAAGGGGGGFMALGAYAGIGSLGRLAPGLGLRLDAAIHRYIALAQEGGSANVLSLSIGLTSLPASR
jgi:hypothetical protein